jgi:hypothetical protein
MPAADITAKDLAVEAGTDPKTMRKFLRSHLDATERSDEKPGQGGRYAFTRKEANKLLKAFAAQASSNAERKAAKAASSEAEVIDDVEEIEDLDLEELDGPSDEELEELDVTDEDDIQELAEELD